ncbi:uncharacterized protein F4822DRAFT_119657 [Hypoxylon trugodes]|uniref:uncharacterized protein n=1 Tax=Hypoxylon trugodes TaxID=326681 RepID=UPI0021912EF1|nr:uncharacterized protein F4822DRAFT_119657 [Hypoxylon trugodes]KAI1392207.1 hypothetical protein F4822DRAFT_119657 [Hypoxylon trugodes]
MILIVLGGISSWMSLSRNREYFSSRMLEGVQIQYFEHIEQRAADEPLQEKPKSDLRGLRPNSIDRFLELPKEPSFSVTSVRRAPKIEDEDDDYLTQMNPTCAIGGSTSTMGPSGRAIRSASVSSRHSVSSIPRGARVHRMSWSSRDFSQWEVDQHRPDPALVRRMSGA